VISKREDSALCKVSIVHEEVLKQVRGEMTREDQLVKMVELFKAFSDPTRLTIIKALMLSPMCVCDLSALLNVTQPAISHHLKTLRQTRLIKFRREGKMVYYTLDDDHVALLYKLGLAHADEEAQRGHIYEERFNSQGFELR